MAIELMRTALWNEKVGDIKQLSGLNLVQISFPTFYCLCKCSLIQVAPELLGYQHDLVLDIKEKILDQVACVSLHLSGLCTQNIFLSRAIILF